MRKKLLWLTAALALGMSLGCNSSSDGADGGTGGNGGGGNGGNGGNGGEVSGPQDIKISTGNTEVGAGDTFFQPMNAPGNMVLLFSQQDDTFTITNTASAALTIQSITIEPDEGVKAEEFTLRDHADNSFPPLDFQPVELAPEAQYNFVIRFYPVNGDLRSAKVTVTYGSGQRYQFTVQGQGRPVETQFFSHGEPAWEKILGGGGSEEYPSALVVAPEGHVFVSGNVSQVIDGFNSDVFVARIEADGTLGWLKIFNGANQDFSRDPGQNGESGGSADSLALDADGNVYVTFAHSPSRSNSTFYPVVLKINGADGALGWAKAWGKDSVSILRDSAESYALTVEGDRVLVTGVVYDNAQTLLLGLNRADGSVAFQKAIEVVPTVNDRAYTIKGDGQGNAFIGGLSNGSGMLLKVAGVDGASPTLTWAKSLGLGTGGNINSLDVDAQGNAYLSVDIRGADTALGVMKVTADGQVSWGRHFNPNGTGDQDNAHVVRVIGDKLYVGGRVGYGGIDGYDAQMGDAALARVNLDGTLDFGAFYFSGKGAEELAEHRLKGIGLSASGDLYLAGQAYTGNNNIDHYWGYWYDSPAETWAEMEVLASAIPDAAMADVEADRVVHDVLDFESVGQGWVDAPTNIMEFQELRAKTGTPPDGDTFITKIPLR